MYKRIKNQINYLQYLFLIKTNKLIKNQIKNPFIIPIIIINFNQLFYLKQLIEFLKTRGFKNIIIIDNKSTYPPLLEYYEEISDKVNVEYMKENEGHMVFFENKFLQKKYGKGYYVLTDADIVPNENLPENFLRILINVLNKYYKATTKVGFALRIDDIPNEFPLKDKVIKWEKHFWEVELEDKVYRAEIDTTFALYKPIYPSCFNNISFLKGIRLGGDYTAKHGGWYKKMNNLSDEEKYFQKTVSNVSSWNINENGESTSKEYDHL